MFGYADSRACDHESGCCRDIESASRIASGTASVDERFASGAAGVEQGITVNRNWSRGGANGFCKPDDLFDGLTLHVQTDQQSRDLSVSARAREHFAHDRAGFFARERLAVVHDSMKSFHNHDLFVVKSTNRTALAAQG
jgi:hypothetical protein